MVSCLLSVACGILSEPAVTIEGSLVQKATADSNGDRIFTEASREPEISEQGSCWSTDGMFYLV